MGCRSLSIKAFPCTMAEHTRMGSCRNTSRFDRSVPARPRRSPVRAIPSHLLSLYRELNPVRAGRVARPEAYRWSSYGVNGWGEPGWLTPHEEYLRLGRDTEERTRAYRELFTHQISEEDLHVVRKAAHYCQPVGDDRFREQIESKYGIRPGQMTRGRPRKNEAD